MDRDSLPSKFYALSSMLTSSCTWVDYFDVKDLVEEPELIASLPEKPIVLEMEPYLVKRYKKEDVLPTPGDDPYVVSERFRKLVDELCPDCVQWLPLKFQIKGEVTPADGFHAMHVIKSYNCIDLERSRASWVTKNEDGSIFSASFDCIVVKEHLEDAPMIFREELIHTDLLRNEFKQACEEKGFDVCFFRLEQFGYSEPPCS